MFKIKYYNSFDNPDNQKANPHKPPNIPSTIKIPSCSSILYT